jgi:hypothetical protein
MDRQSFEEYVLRGDTDEYVSEEALAYLRENAEFRVIHRSALEKEGVEQRPLVSVALPESTDNWSDGEFLDAVKEKLGDGMRGDAAMEEANFINDIQKGNLRHQGEVANTIVIWIHGSGYSAFALNG